MIYLLVGFFVGWILLFVGFIGVIVLMVLFFEEYVFFVDGLFWGLLSGMMGVVVILGCGVFYVLLMCFGLLV